MYYEVIIFDLNYYITLFDQNTWLCFDRIKRYNKLADVFHILILDIFTTEYPEVKINNKY